MRAGTRLYQLWKLTVMLIDKNSKNAHVKIDSVYQVVFFLKRYSFISRLQQIRRLYGESGPHTTSAQTI